MFPRILKNAKLKPSLFSSFVFRSNSNGFKVTVVGSSGEIGLALCLQLKQSPLIDELCLYDKTNPAANARDLYYIDTKTNVTSYVAPTESEKAFSVSLIIFIIQF